MTDYNKYVLAVNKIFEIINKLKSSIQDPDNLSRISNIEEYKTLVVNSAKEFQNGKEQPKLTKENVEERL